MNLFPYEQICKLNESELSVYNYVSAHLTELETMNIRELSAASKVSTTTVLRFCSKIGCDGYTELKYRVRQALEKQGGSAGHLPSVIPAVQYLQNAIDNREINIRIEKSAELCLRARQVLFIGIGTSGNLGEYGARFFSSVGITSFAITDPFYPPPKNDMEDTVVIALSVSGETSQIISLVDGYRKRRVKVISITNTDQCTLARMSEINFSYYMPLIYAFPETGEVNLTTQIPVLYLLETLMRRIHDKIRKPNP